MLARSNESCFPQARAPTRAKKPCSYFVNYGKCKFGDGCNFSHDL